MRALLKAKVAAESVPLDTVFERTFSAMPSLASTSFLMKTSRHHDEASIQEAALERFDSADIWFEISNVRTAAARGALASSASNL